ncbi:glycosyltransferase family 2 protein [Pseudorhodoferax sp. Leaf265]|uniref:glycosyltransferase n=1 Tax=Pseudorhodoferax sp. Leaf265 TaxID=1736315 RepID=UPI0006FF6D49|nr:glycosyltransferase [Pseudorhodoferax sp. Leaf265]KQP21180.1 hypothetical protein ASF45_03065 [Pseudorhodoferax sp. Leaf265]
MSSISVVMPTYRDSAHAITTAARLSRQLGPQDELLIVDNGSGGEHLKACEAYAGQHSGVAIKVLVCGTRGSYAARNLGASQARGDILAFTDAGCVPSEDWLETIRRHFEAGSSDRVAGPIVMTYTNSPPSVVELVDARTHLHQDWYVAHGWAATANTAVRRAVFQIVGGFNQTLQSGGDYEFGIRAHAHGYRIDWCPAMVVEHGARNTVRDLMKKRRRIRLGQAQLASLAEFSALLERAAQAGPIDRPAVARRAYPAVGTTRWLLVRLACRLLYLYERRLAPAK